MTLYPLAPGTQTRSPIDFTLAPQPAAALPGIYTYYFADLRTNQIIGEFRLTNVTFGSMLNGSGSFRATLPMGDARVEAARPIDATIPGRTAIYIDRNGQLVWGGILWTRRYVSSTRTLEFGGSGFWSYFQSRSAPGIATGRFITATKTYTAADQLFIARDLVNYAQSKTGGDIGVLVGAETSGVLRDRTYNAWDLKDVGSAIQEVSALDNGFDFAIDVAWESGIPTKRLHLGYPRRGAVASASGLVWEMPGNLESYTYPEDGAACANQVTAVGNGQGTAQLTSVRSAAPQLAAGFPLLEGLTFAKDVATQAQLDASALSEVTARQNPVAIPEAWVRADIDPVVGSYVLGDDCRLRITDERFNLGRDAYGFIGPGIDLAARIVGIEVTPQQGASETVRLLMAAS